MFERLHSGYAKLPLLGELAIEFQSEARGRLWIDIYIHGMAVDLNIGCVKATWSRTRVTAPTLTFLCGWLLQSPLQMLGII